VNNLILPTKKERSIDGEIETHRAVEMEYCRDREMEKRRADR
jgi:hypothetical protein